MIFIWLLQIRWLIEPPHSNAFLMPRLYKTKNNGVIPDHHRIVRAMTCDANLLWFTSSWQSWNSSLEFYGSTISKATRQSQQRIVLIPAQTLSQKLLSVSSKRLLQGSKSKGLRRSCLEGDREGLGDFLLTFTEISDRRL